MLYYTNKGPLVSDVSSSGSVLIGGAGSGIDCSGFVSAAVGTYSFNGTKPGTSHIINNSLSVLDVVGNSPGWMSYSGLQPMDIFISSGHVLFFDRRKLDGTGIYTLESTTAYGNLLYENRQGAKRYVQNWTYLSGKTHKTFWSKQTGDDFNLPFTTTATKNIIEGQGQYFKFSFIGNIHEPCVMYITISSGDADLYVYRSDYSLVGYSANGGTSTDTVSWISLPGQSCYGYVYGYVNSTYTIRKYG